MVMVMVQDQDDDAQSNILKSRLRLCNPYRSCRGHYIGSPTFSCTFKLQASSDSVQRHFSSFTSHGHHKAPNQLAIVFLIVIDHVSVLEEERIYSALMNGNVPFQLISSIFWATLRLIGMSMRQTSPIPGFHIPIGTVPLGHFAYL